MNDVLVCIDDTDMPGTKGTGWLCQEICEILETRTLGRCQAISRHQLFVHDDIPFTSHNSSMCFQVCLAQGVSQEALIDFMVGLLKKRSIKGSDPGLCVAELNGNLDTAPLIAFGKKAKIAVSSKAAAYDLARACGIHLSEHGGTGDGIIGAIAGIGLRLSGDDGRYRGWYHLGRPGDPLKVGDLIQYDFVDAVLSPSGEDLPPEILVALGSKKTKTVRLTHRQVLLTLPNEGAGDNDPEFRIITKAESKAY